jgi:hypothetical protein
MRSSSARSRRHANASIVCSPSTATRASIFGWRQDNKVYFIEANPNPILASDEDFALSAGKAGCPYPQLIDRIVRQGMKTVRD